MLTFDCQTCEDLSLFTYFHTDEQLGYFHILAITNKALYVLFKYFCKLIFLFFDKPNRKCFKIYLKIFQH